MKTIRLKARRCLTDEQAQELGGTFLDDGSYDLLVEEDCKVLKPDGSVLLIFRRKVLPVGVCKLAYPALRTAASKTDNRGYASGVLPPDLDDEALARLGLVRPARTKLHKVKQDGTLSSKSLTFASEDVQQHIRNAKVQVVKQDDTVSRRTQSLPAALRRSAKARVHRIKADGTVSNTSETSAGKIGVYRIKGDGTVSNTLETTGSARLNLRTGKGAIVKEDGTASLQDRAKPVESGIIGFFNREARFPYCRTTAYNLEHPDRFAAAVPFIRAVNKVFRREAPERFAAQMEMVRRASEDFVIHGTAFTTVTVNRNWQTAVHTDKGDLKQGFGVMSALCAGRFKGCHLVFPQFRVAVNMRTRDVLLADVHEWHGNTPFVGIEGAYERISTVLYFREKIKHCGSAEQELQRAKSRRKGQSLTD